MTSREHSCARHAELSVFRAGSCILAIKNKITDILAGGHPPNPLSVLSQAEKLFNKTEENRKQTAPSALSQLSTTTGSGCCELCYLVSLRHQAAKELITGLFSGMNYGFSSHRLLSLVDKFKHYCSRP